MAGLSYHKDDQIGGLVPIVPLQIEDIRKLQLGWSSRYDKYELEQILRYGSGLALWSPDTREYVVGGPWRHRGEILSVLDVVARARAARLLEELASIAAEHGARLVIMSEHQEARSQGFYASAGYELIEEILIYQLPRVRSEEPRFTGLHFERVSVDDDATLDELLALDREAFPWLWWNSAEEFRSYDRSPGVEIHLGRDDAGEPVSYIGVTGFRSWGHLDRIAVAPERQGHGFGLETLDWAVYVMGRRGARRLALSTQARNQRSRRLYERYGFQRSSSQDYKLYGRWLGQPDAV
jgi:ribosomal protein S18 acetylase RimI-like enzyme